MKRHILVLALLLLAPMPAVEAGDATFEWWGPTQIGQGHHIRVPVTVSNDLAHPVTNAPVAVELDIATLLSDVGWISSPSGDRDVLSGFHLDTDSIRVVSMTNHRPQDNFNGRLRVSDSTYPADDLRRYEVPSVVVEGSLVSRTTFDAAVQPTITVLWRVPETLQPGDAMHYAVYFDSDLAHDKKEPADRSGTVAGGDIESLFWSGPALTSWGYVVPPSGQSGKVQVTALHDDTHARIFTAVPGQPFQPLPKDDVVLFEQAFESVGVPVTTSGAVLVRVDADKPVLVQGVSAGTIPSLDGGMTGRDFVFALTRPVDWEQDVLYVKAVDPRDDDGALEPTKVVVTPVGGGPSLTYATGTDETPFNYTVSPRDAFVGTGSTSCRQGGYTSPLLPPGPGVYRAQVEGERVSLQLLSVGGMSQVPSHSGAPAGTQFWSPLPWTDDEIVSPVTRECGTTTRAGSFVTTGTGSTSSLSVTSAELAYQVFPPGSPSPPGPPEGRYPPPQAVPASPAFAGAFGVSSAAAADRPLQFNAQSPVRLFVGNEPAQVDVGSWSHPHAVPVTAGGAVPQVHGPLGGSGAGREFTGLGRSVVFAPFANTAADVQSTFTSGSEEQRLSIAQGSYQILDDRSQNNVLRSFDLRSNVPVLVSPLNTVSTGFFAGVPAFLSASAGAAEFRGYLVDLSSSDGLDPATRSTAPGEPVEYSIRVSNLGRGIGNSNLDDVIQVAGEVPTGWSATLDGLALGDGNTKSISLGSQDSKTMVLTVTPPPEIPSGTSGTVRLTATSQGNPLVSDQLDVITFAKTVYDVGLWFDGVGGPKVQENRTLDALGQGGFNMVLLNQGSKAEAVELKAEFKGSETAWGVDLGNTGSSTMQIHLEPETPRMIPLTMTAPENLVDGEASVVVTAALADVPAAQDAVQAIAVRAAPSDIVLEVKGPTRFVHAGESAVFDVNLRNDGEGGAAVRLDVRADLGPGWDQPRIVMAGTEQELGEIALTGKDAIDLQIVADSHADAEAGISTILRFGARAVGQPSGAEAILTGQVLPDHRLTVLTPPLPIPLSRLDHNVSAEVRLQNDGNLNESLEVRPFDVPAGWNVSSPTSVFIPQGSTQILALGIRAPPAAPAGTYPLVFHAVSADGNLTAIRLDVQVGSVSSQHMQDTAALEVQPGTSARTEVPVTNHGNIPLLVSVGQDPQESWELERQPQLTLMPGQATSIEVAWQVPRGAPVGLSNHSAHMIFEPPEGPSAATTETVQVQIHVGKADLAWQGVETLDAAAGHLVHAVLENRGERPARDFAVQLLVDGDVVDEIMVGELPAGGAAQIDFLQLRPGVATLVADAGDAVLESDESNNQHATRSAVGDEKAPLPTLALVLGCLGAALWRRRSG